MDSLLVWVQSNILDEAVKDAQGFQRNLECTSQVLGLCCGVLKAIWMKKCNPFLFMIRESKITTFTLVRDLGFLFIPELLIVSGGHLLAAPAPTLCEPSSFMGEDNVSSCIGDRWCSFIRDGGVLWTAWCDRWKCWLMGHKEPRPGIKIRMVFFFWKSYINYGSIIMIGLLK